MKNKVIDSLVTSQGSAAELAIFRDVYKVSKRVYGLELASEKYLLRIMRNGNVLELTYVDRLNQTGGFKIADVKIPIRLHDYSSSTVYTMTVDNVNLALLNVNGYAIFLPML